MDSRKISISAGGMAVLVAGAFLVMVYTQARQGNTTAMVALAMLGAVLFIAVGAAIAVGATVAFSQVQQKAFRDNATENMMLLQNQARTQNELTRGAMMLARDQQKMLPAGMEMNPMGLVDVDQGIYEGMYDDEEA
jgi:ABC-type nickel/cobalt efflux system permease component RcnA